MRPLDIIIGVAPFLYYTQPRVAASAEPNTAWLALSVVLLLTGLRIMRVTQFRRWLFYMARTARDAGQEASAQWVLDALARRSVWAMIYQLNRPLTLKGQFPELFER